MQCLQLVCILLTCQSPLLTRGCNILARELEAPWVTSWSSKCTKAYRQNNEMEFSCSYASFCAAQSLLWPSKIWHYTGVNSEFQISSLNLVTWNLASIWLWDQWESFWSTNQGPLNYECPPRWWKGWTWSWVWTFAGTSTCAWTYMKFSILILSWIWSDWELGVRWDRGLLFTWVVKGTPLCMAESCIAATTQPTLTPYRTLTRTDRESEGIGPKHRTQIPGCKGQDPGGSGSACLMTHRTICRVKIIRVTGSKSSSLDLGGDAGFRFKDFAMLSGVELP